MNASMRRGHMRGKLQLPPTCARCLKAAKFVSRIWKTIRAFRTPTVCAACRKCMAPCATRFAHARSVVETESGSATDNPLVFSETGDVLSGGNFHGAPLALAFDYAAIAVTDLMSITERRIDRLVNPDANENLPPFLTRQPGTSSGFHDVAGDRGRAS